MRFSLRNLIVFVLLTGLIAGLVGIRFLQISRQHTAVKSIKEAGGSVRTAEESALQGDPFSAPEIEVPAESAIGALVPEAPQWLRDLVGTDGFDAVKVVNLNGRKISDHDLFHLRNLPALRELSISDTSIGDAGLQNLGSLQQLQSLSLYKTRITDDGLRHLKQFPALRQLSINSTAVSDEGFVHLPPLV